MFSKVLAFGIGALALVRAASVVEPGTYTIYNEAFGHNDQLGSYQAGDLYVSRNMPFSGPFGMWMVETSGDPAANEYTITNVGNDGTYATAEDAISTKAGKGDSFAIEPAGEGLFAIKVPNQDKVWTIAPGVERSGVYLKGQDGDATAWRFEKVKLL